MKKIKRTTVTDVLFLSTSLCTICLLIWLSPKNFGLEAKEFFGKILCKMPKAIAWLTLKLIVQWMAIIIFGW